MSRFITIEGFEKLSKQELFDMSVAHIAKTRQKSMKTVVISGGVGSYKCCSYAGSGCAAACFIKPEYREMAGGLSNGDTAGWYTVLEAGRAPAHEESLISGMQGAHDDARDGYAFLSEWKENMRWVAEQHSLSTALLDAVLV